MILKAFLDFCTYFVNSERIHEIKWATGGGFSE
ncbi:hypothetical protein SAMN05443094_101220 [Domibacillus enclensis]|uniref:Uncharacterized protein n=1 Tax=Domibacillus enclensis TaxID=1017273 RepID=A0A1N6NP82_9BACI|nr:hypothetical protein SAMN05443094_101220 [Domibacillus enclensis]